MSNKFELQPSAKRVCGTLAISAHMHLCTFIQRKSTLFLSLKMRTCKHFEVVYTCLCVLLLT